MLNGSYLVQLAFLEQSTGNTSGNFAESVTVPKPYPRDYGFDDGTGAGQADRIWSTLATLSATSVTHDLTSLTGSRGAVSFAKVKLFYLRHEGESGTLTVGNATSNPWGLGGSAATATRTIGPGGVVFFVEPATGFTISGSAKNLKIDSGAGTIPYRLIIVGTSV